MATKPPTIQQLVDIIAAYNTARQLELRQQPVSGWPAGYKNELMEELYDCALGAAKLLKPAVNIVVEPPK